jgi:HEAT repeat protein
MQERAAFSHSVGPRHPPAPHKLTSMPSIIVDTDSEYAVLVDRLLMGDDVAESELLRDGQAAMPAVMARFPGPLRIHREQLKEPLPRVADCGPILSVIARMRRVALPSVLPFVSSDDIDLRTWATFLLVELSYPEAVDALVPRLFDADPRIRLVARAASRRIATVAQEALLGALGRVLRDPRATRHGKIGVLETLGDIREPLAVPLLIRYLEDEDEEVATVARRSLIQITRQDFARETKKWLGWWGANANRHRIEWLVDALVDETPGIRRAAGDELKALTNESFGYYDDLTKTERERAQQRYRDWWSSEGRARFTR